MTTTVICPTAIVLVLVSCREHMTLTLTRLADPHSYDRGTPVATEAELAEAIGECAHGGYGEYIFLLRTE